MLQRYAQRRLLRRDHRAELIDMGRKARHPRQVGRADHGDTVRSVHVYVGGEGCERATHHSRALGSDRRNQGTEALS